MWILLKCRCSFTFFFHSIASFHVCCTFTRIILFSVYSRLGILILTCIICTVSYVSFKISFYDNSFTCLLQRLLNPIKIERWAVVNFSARCDTSQLSRELINCGRSKGIVCSLCFCPSDRLLLVTMAHKFCHTLSISVFRLLSVLLHL